MLRHAEHRDLRIIMIRKAIQRITNRLCHVVSVRLFGRPDLTGKHALCLDFACGLRDAVPGHDLNRDRHACGNRLCIRELGAIRLPDGLLIACRSLWCVSVSGSCERGLPLPVGSPGIMKNLMFSMLFLPHFRSKQAAPALQAFRLLLWYRNSCRSQNRMPNVRGFSLPGV